MLDGRVLEASQIEYKPFGKPPLKRERQARTRLQSDFGLATSLFQAFCALFGPKESGDEAVTSGFWAKKRRFGQVPRRTDVLETGDFGGDNLSGLTRYVEEPRQADVLLGSTSAVGFRRKTSEFGGPGCTFDAGHKKRTFRSSPFSALFAPKTEW